MIFVRILVGDKWEVYFYKIRFSFVKWGVLWLDGRKDSVKKDFFNLSLNWSFKIYYYVKFCYMCFIIVVKNIWKCIFFIRFSFRILLYKGIYIDIKGIFLFY